MKRMMLMALGITASLVLAACGGGGTTATPNDSNNSDNSLIVDVQGTGGGRTVSFVPGKLDVHFGGDAGALAETAARYGFNVEFTRGNWAGVDIGGADPQTAIKELEKEYNIFSAERVQQVSFTEPATDAEGVIRSASHTPFDPYYADRFIGFPGDGAGSWSTYFGQAWPMNSMGFNGAWDISDPLNIDGQVAAEPVRIAIIDAGWLDYSTEDRAGFEETIIDDTASGYVNGSGTFTAGLPAATWETYAEFVDADPDPDYYRVNAVRGTGEAMLGILAATHNDYSLGYRDIDGSSTIEEGEVWNEGMAGINPNATYVLIKTGSRTVGENSWTFTDQEIAASIEHAWNAADCDIILLGMFINGAVPANVQTAITNARDNGALVIAPAGDVVSSFDGGTGTFTEAAVDITTNPVWPAAATGCISVTGTGYNRVGTLPDAGAGVANLGVGWTPAYSAPFNGMFTQVASYCNTGADIAGMGWGFGFGRYLYIMYGGTGTELDPHGADWREDFATGNVARFSTTYPAAYVAGAASIVFQALSFANGTAPSDEDVETTLLDTVNYNGMAGILNNGGYLNANAAMMDAISGGSLIQYEPAMSFTTTDNLSEWFSQARDAVTRGTDLSVSPTIANGTAPFTLHVDWNGVDEEEVLNWNSGDAVTLTGGFDTLGIKNVIITVTDANDQIRSISPAIFVINPLAASITVENAQGQNTGTNLKVLTNYRFKSNATNIYTGDIGGTPNTTTFNWWFTSDPLTDPPDSTDPNPTFAFSSTGNYTITLAIVEDVRPGFTATLNVAVIP